MTDRRRCVGSAAPGAANVKRATLAEPKVALSVLADLLGEGSWWMERRSGDTDL